MYVPLLDRLSYRHPSVGGRARRSARDERPAFGDLDDRRLAALADVAIDPSRFARRGMVRAADLMGLA